MVHEFGYVLEVQVGTSSSVISPCIRAGPPADLQDEARKTVAWPLPEASTRALWPRPLAVSGSARDRSNKPAPAAPQMYLR